MGSLTCKILSATLTLILALSMIGPAKALNDAGNTGIEVKESFYKGEIMNPKDSINLIRKASVANLVGSRIVGEALNIGIVKPKAVIKIAGVPHAQIVKM